MLTSLIRNIASIEERLVLLSPCGASVSGGFRNVTVDAQRHGELVRGMQQLRGSIYLEDGAVRREDLSGAGLHQTPEDEKSWHLLALNSRAEISACVWYMEHETPASIPQLRAAECPLYRAPEWRETLESALENELARAEREGLRYFEVGGWAVAKGSRCTGEGILLALAAYSLGGVFGGALGLSTATVRHSSSTILRRLGGSPLEGHGTNVPAYYDPRYGCDMELLRFDTRLPNPKYRQLIDKLKVGLEHVNVLTGVVTGDVASSLAAA